VPQKNIGARFEPLTKKAPYKVYKQNRHRIRGLVHLPLRTAATFGEDIKEMMARHLTFEEAVASPDFTLMAKQRLRIIEIDVRKKLRAVL
jgi:hypothetical protein